nr:NAC domain-containing protein [Tanacetum cinerariifolium]
METYSYEFYGGSPHPGFDCQTQNVPVYERGPCYNQNFGYDQPPYYSPSQPQQFHYCEVCGDTKESDDVTNVIFDEEQFLRQQSTAHVTPPPLAYTPPPPFLATMEPLDTLLIEDKVISTTFARKNNKFLKSSVDDPVLIPRESEVTLTPSEWGIGKAINPSNLETIDPIPDPRMFDVPLSNDDSISRSFDVTISNILFDFDDNYLLLIDNKNFDDKFKDLSSLDPLKAPLLINESILLVTPLLDAKQICLREVARFDPIFSLTQPGYRSSVEIKEGWESVQGLEGSLPPYKFNGIHTEKGMEKLRSRSRHAQPEDIHEFLRKLLEDLQIINEELAEYINSPSWNHPAYYDDDDEYSIQDSEKSPIAIAPVLPTEEPDNSLSMGDEHLDTISETESNEIIKSSVEDLVPIPSESEGILDNMCDLIGELAHIDLILPRIDETNSDPKDDIRFIKKLLYDDTSSEDDSFEDIEYVEASPPDSELVRLEEVQDELI